MYVKIEYKKGKKNQIKPVETTLFFLDLNPLSWSSHNLLTVALGSAVYLWNSASGM